MWSKALLSVLAGAACQLLGLALCLPILNLPTGARVTPMSLICLLLLPVILGPALRDAIMKDDRRPDGNRALGLLGAFLCYTVFPVSILLFNLFGWIRGVHFA